MDDLAQFLRARLDEDEQTAHGTETPLEWHQGPVEDPEWESDEVVHMWPPEHHTPYEQDKHWRGLTADSVGMAAHIARHDPARVLAEVDAKRRLLDTWLPEAMKTDEQVNEEWGYGSTLADDVLRLLALPYADHPDYRDGWRP